MTNTLKKAVEAGLVKDPSCRTGYGPLSHKSGLFIKCAFNLRRHAERKCQKLPDRQASGLSPWHQASFTTSITLLTTSFLSESSPEKQEAHLSHLQQCLTGFADFITLYAGSFLAESLKAQLLLSPHKPSEFFVFFSTDDWGWYHRKSRQSAWNPMLKKKFPKKQESIFILSFILKAVSLPVGCELSLFFLNSSVGRLQNECAISLISIIANTACMRLQLEWD